MRMHKQQGATLMEVLIAMSLSLVVTAAMIALMSNSLGSTARIIKMTKLSDDMRIAMQMMTRDVRRSSYNSNSMYCYANADCGTDGAATLPGEILMTDGDGDGDNDCFTFLLDRDWDDSTANVAGGFRRVVSGGVGILEMWTGDTPPDCTEAAGEGSWVQVTNPDNMDIFAFSVDEDLSYEVEIFNDGTNTLSQIIRKVHMNMQGRLVMDNTIERQVEDVISVRNDLLLAGPA
jgi:type II secretory pathway pseudopilin PulG